MTYILSGTVAQIVRATQVQIHAGEFQIMSAETGIRHSEYNARDDAFLHLYQIWILLAQNGLQLHYEQRRFTAKAATGALFARCLRRLVRVFQDVILTRWALPRGQS
ncbi:pirin family protein, partial [Sodalis-like endosymbiont of Proechinophthirus fluctus]|uniref:pirin family protein n=1 Tax=Sodalis-like endosymbiont of Proechinophthirus fluctus TaxID=1462730 RepID=UPI00164FAF73